MARKSGDAERAPLLATTERVDCELGNGTVDREEEGARRERGRGRWVTKGRAAWVLGGCAVVAGAAACALGTRANGGSLMTWKSALGTKRENAAARRRARAVRSRREAARERRAEERRALEDHANDVLREIAREASPEDARRMVEEAIRRVEITKKSEAFAHAYDMARLGDEELVDDLEVDPHTIMDPKEFAKLTVDEKNALRRRMRTALRKVREELKTNAPLSARAKGQAAARRPGANVAAANASAAKRRRDAADANVRAKGEEKRKEISNDAEKLIQEIREGVEKTSSALREAAKEEGTKEAADKAEKDIAQLVHATNERIELIQKKTEKRLSLISAVTERHLSGRTSRTKTLTNAVTKSKPTVAADADSARKFERHCRRENSRNANMSKQRSHTIMVNVEMRTITPTSAVARATSPTKIPPPRANASERKFATRSARTRRCSRNAQNPSSSLVRCAKRHANATTANALMWANRDMMRSVKRPKTPPPSANALAMKFAKRSKPRRRPRKRCFESA